MSTARNLVTSPKFWILAIVVGIAMFFIGTASATPSGLVSSWPADGDANDAFDGNDGILEGDAGFATGKVGQAFSLDGAGDYVRVPAAANLDLSDGSFTLTAWIKPVSRSGLSSNHQWIIDKADNNADIDYLFGLDARNSGDAQIRIITGLNLANDLQGGVVPAGVFTHVAAVQDVGAGKVRLYVDGVEVKSATLTVGSVAAAGDLLIGTRKFNTQALSQRNYLV